MDSGGATIRSGPSLQAVGVSLAYEHRLIVEDLSLDVPDGGFTVIVGPNACGKSTLLRGLARLLKPKAGTVLLDGHDIHRRSTREVATRLGILPQQPVAPEGITVSDLVARGRHPHQSWLRQFSSDDEAAVSSALAAAGVSDLADRTVDELSGGQRQRVWIALALAQGTPLLLLDEPTTFLDMAHQVEVLDLLARLNTEEHRTIVAVLHDLNLACRYTDHIVALRSRMWRSTMIRRSLSVVQNPAATTWSSMYSKATTRAGGRPGSMLPAEGARQRTGELLAPCAGWREHQPR